MVAGPRPRRQRMPGEPRVVSNSVACPGRGACWPTEPGPTSELWRLPPPRAGSWSPSSLRPTALAGSAASIAFMLARHALCVGTSRGGGHLLRSPRARSGSALSGPGKLHQAGQRLMATALQNKAMQQMKGARACALRAIGSLRAPFTADRQCSTHLRRRMP